MSEEFLDAHLRYYGISPWEVEVVYGYLNSRFNVTQEEIEQDDENFVSMFEINIPLAFSEEFFNWFDFRRWEKVKALFKEMKRRRGSGNALKIIINFAGNPDIQFILDANDREWYNNAVEKIDFVIELLPYHLDPEKLPQNVNKIAYSFDEAAKRWRLNQATVKDKKFVFQNNGWKIIT